MLFFQVILSVYLANQKLGASYYDTDTQILYIMKDIREDKEYKMLKKCKFYNNIINFVLLIITMFAKLCFLSMLFSPLFSYYSLKLIISYTVLTCVFLRLDYLVI